MLSAVEQQYLQRIKALIVFVYFFPKFAIRIHPILLKEVANLVEKWDEHVQKSYPQSKRRVCLVLVGSKVYLTACSVQTNTNDNLDSAINMPSKSIIQNSTQVISHTEEHSDPNIINQAVDEICVVLCDDDEEKKEKIKQMREEEILRNLIRVMEEKECQLRKMQQQQGIKR